jgi:hypothetical protein
LPRTKPVETERRLVSGAYELWIAPRNSRGLSSFMTALQFPLKIASTRIFRSATGGPFRRQLIRKMRMRDLELLEWFSRTRGERQKPTMFGDSGWNAFRRSIASDSAVHCISP